MTDDAATAESRSTYNPEGYGDPNSVYEHPSSLRSPPEPIDQENFKNGAYHYVDAKVEVLRLVEFCSFFGEFLKTF